MSRINELKTKIKNIRNTEKITKAMEMISTSKMRKAQDIMRASRPFSVSITEVINNLSYSCLDQHDFFIKRPENNIGLLIISSDRGLCGGLNINLFKKCYSYIVQCQHNNIQIKIATIGEKSKKFFSSRNIDNIKIIASLEQISQKPKIRDVIGVVQVLLQEYTAKRLDSIYIAYNEFESMMKQNPVIKPLLPISADLSAKNQVLQTEYLVEPSINTLLDLLLKRYIESLVYQGVVENIASEHSARMIAMKNATDSANELLDNLQIYLNKERQALITKEIAEIVGGCVGI